MRRSADATPNPIPIVVPSLFRLGQQPQSDIG